MSSQILILDDEKNYLLILEALLMDAGYQVTALDDPETGLAYLDESEVDVVITDMKMPKVTGQQVLEHVKKNYPRITSYNVCYTKLLRALAQKQVLALGLGVLGGLVHGEHELVVGEGFRNNFV